MKSLPKMGPKMGRKPYFGLRGKALDMMLIWAVIMPTYVLFGYYNGVAGGLVGLPAWRARFPDIDTDSPSLTAGEKAHNAQIQGTVVAIYPLGALFGALSCIIFGDYLGRIRTIMLGSVVTCIGSIIECSAYDLAQLIVGRFIVGLGFGSISATAPNWQTECSRAGHRGFVVMLEGLFISAGLAIQAWINFGMSHTTGDVSWRFPLALPCFFAIIIFFSMPLWPESPRWLIKMGRVEEAKQVLSAFDDVPLDDPAIASEIHKIDVSLQETGKGKLRDIFRNGPGRFANRAFIAAAAQCFQQMGGINALAFYQTTIFKTFLGLDSNVAAILSATVFSFQTLVAPLGVFTIDKIGRRKLMIFGAWGMGMCMAIIAGTTSHPDNKAALGAGTAFVYLFSLFFVTGYLGLAFLYSSEIAPLSVRTPITALSTTSTWVFNFTVVEVSPPGFDSLSYKYFIIYAVLNWFLALPTVYFFFPETQGLHLEDVDRIFLESSNMFQPVRVAKRLRAHAKISAEGDVEIDEKESI